MERIRLGSTGLKVSPFSFGTMTLGEPVNEETSLDLLDLVTDSGVNFIDTSNSYNAGRSEEIIGQWMNTRANREQIVLATKVRYPVGNDSETIGLTPKKRQNPCKTRGSGVSLALENGGGKPLYMVYFSLFNAPAVHKVYTTLQPEGCHFGSVRDGVCPNAQATHRQTFGGSC